MAVRTVRQLFDDIDGSEIADGRGGKVEFSYQGVHYRIDLSATNTAKFEKALQPFMDAAVKARGGHRRTPRPRAASTGSPIPQTLAAIREWARENGHNVSDRGRIRAEIVQAFNAAHKPG